MARVRQPPLRIQAEPAWLLQSWPWRETSLVIEVLSQSHGRLPLVAKGVRRATSPWRSLLLPFQPLLLDWSGRGEVKTLTQVAWAGPALALPPSRSLSAWYASELLLKLLPREDAYPRAHKAYGELLLRLSNLSLSAAGLLRHFEWQLLCEAGYGFDPAVDAQGLPVQADAFYRLNPEHGLESVSRAETAGPALIEGRVLLALAQQATDPQANRSHWEILGASARLRRGLRECLDYHMQGRVLLTPGIFQELQAL